MLVWSLRSFLNTDTPALAKIWSDHSLASPPLSHCSVGLWDQCVLSKSYFDAADLVLAVDDCGVAQGLIHFGSSLAESGLDASADCGMIHRLCVRPQNDEHQIASLLIDHATKALRTRGMHRCLGVGSIDGSTFYLGIADGDNLMGVAATDQRTLRWLQQAGFQHFAPTECWSVALETFRPPMDRTQIAIRRACTISRILDDYPSNWWMSNMLGHCEQSRFHLSSRGPDRVEMEVMLWAPDTTIRGVDANTARFRMPTIPEDDENRERLIYLIAESLRQLYSERKRHVRVVTLSQHLISARILQRLGFRCEEHGMVFERHLNPHAQS